MKILVTGGAGFIGSALVRALLEQGHTVSVLDNCFRGRWSSLPSSVELFGYDICNAKHVELATRHVDEVIHLAYVNGNKLFYEQPALVLRVATQGMINLLEACQINNVKRFMLASSSEVCRARVDDMNETVPLVIPDPFNPRYSYSAGKIISEMMAIHSGQFDWLTIFRPFNIYGSNMAPGHVIPDFRMQLCSKIAKGLKDPIPFEIIGSGDETRSFCYIDDFISGLMAIREHGKHMEIYNVGTPEETTIRALAQQMGSILGHELSLTEGNGLREGSIQRRKPEIEKLLALGYKPKVSLNEGLRRVLCQ